MSVRAKLGETAKRLRGGIPLRFVTDASGLSRGTDLPNNVEHEPVSDFRSVVRECWSALIEQVEGLERLDHRSVRTHLLAVSGYAAHEGEVLGLLVDYAAQQRGPYAETPRSRRCAEADSAFVAACHLYQAVVVSEMIDTDASFRRSSADPIVDRMTAEQPSQHQ